MQIGELARRTGIAASRIRFYERQAVIPRAGRGPNGYRDYPETAVKMLTLIQGAQQLGFTLGEIRSGFILSAPKLPSPAAMAKALREKLATIDRHLQDVEDRRRQIMALLDELEA